MPEFETLEVKIPKDVLIGIKKEKFIEDMKLFTAMSLYKENFLSLGKAAELSGKNKDDFIEALSEHGIDVIKDAISSLFRENAQLKVSTAIELYKKGEVSLSKAAEFAGMTTIEFKDILGKRGFIREIEARQAA
jgi:predicted HTH domain antitoxin